MVVIRQFRLSLRPFDQLGSCTVEEFRPVSYHVVAGNRVSYVVAWLAVTKPIMAMIMEDSMVPDAVGLSFSVALGMCTNSVHGGVMIAVSTRPEKVTDQEASKRPHVSLVPMTTIAVRLEYTYLPVLIGALPSRKCKAVLRSVGRVRRSPDEETKGEIFATPRWAKQNASVLIVTQTPPSILPSPSPPNKDTCIALTCTSHWHK